MEELCGDKTGMEGTGGFQRKKEAVKAQRQKAGSLETRLKVWALGSGHGVCER